MSVTVLAAVAGNGVIGQGTALPWKFPEDMRHFRMTTMGHTLIMGRRTWFGMPNELEGRKIIVVSRSIAQPCNKKLPHVSVHNNLRTLLRERHDMKDKETFIVGGGEIYHQAMQSQFVDRLLITWVYGDHEGDVVFPEIDYRVWRSAKVWHKWDGGHVQEYTRTGIPL